MKKRGGKGTRALKHRTKDLSPRRTRNVTGGLQGNMQKKADDTVSGVQQKIG